MIDIVNHFVHKSASALVLAAAVVVVGAQDDKPGEPFRIADNLYQVGSWDIGTYLITTPAGHILIDAGFESTVPMIEANVAKLGFKVDDIKILLNTQGHKDHAGGFAALKKRTGAQLMVSSADADLIERGGHGDFSLGDTFTFPPATVDRRLKDGDTVSLGGMVLTAHLTPGHTQGCTTWTFDTKDATPSTTLRASRTLHVVDLCGLAVLDTTKIEKGMAGYPTIVEDYERTFATLRRLPVDIFIGAHVSYYDGRAKAEKAKGSANPNLFIDPEGFRRAVDNGERQFRARLTAAKMPAPQ
jgi:metallo-beta-lactamase class B